MKNNKNKKKYFPLQQIQKRDGMVVPFDEKRITRAVFRAMQSVKEGDEAYAVQVTQRVLDALLALKKEKEIKNFIPHVETIQDIVENELIASNFLATAKSYILYRKERSLVRGKIGFVPEKIKELVAKSKKYFKNPLAEFVYYRTYAKWKEEEGRRETWIETIDRYIDFMRDNINGKLTEDEYAEIRETILKQEAMPSMRLLQFAGKATRRTNVCAYNCSFIAPRSFQDFAEIMYISMCGTGVGWSVESENIQALPQIQRQTGKKLSTLIIPDSKEGWADAFSFGLKTWFAGEDIIFDYSLIRPAGSRLKTMGGKSSGPESLRSLLEFTRERILGRQGRHLSNLDAHDIICKIGECVVAGGVRRSAMISLSDLDDEAIRDSKKGQFYNTEGQRMLANNSAVYLTKPTSTEFIDEWIALMKSGSGERGIFNRGGLAGTLPKRRLNQWKGGIYPAWGTNPCGEIVLQSKQFCNLSEVVARADDTEETLMKKVRVATILGTYQSTLTYFPYLSKEWKKNCEKERLLGVSVTGQWDCQLVRDPKILEKMKLAAIETNKKYAKRFGIEQSTCITCVKPSGTVSQTVDCASGMHPRHSSYYIRRIRISATDALFKMLKDQGVPYYPEIGQTLETASTFVLEFPVKAPDGAICKDDINAIAQLEHWKIVKKHFTEHNPSVTVSVGDDEWLKVANWVYENWDLVGGLSFLPRSNHVYQLAPYEVITKEKYEEMKKRLGNLDFSKIVTYERDDETEVKRELACVGGLCEI
ncbi:ribonucleoside-triphosphate reductase [Candidatus Nomurabacteria bacterium RIFCSPHIGHO2_02_FULL_41_18]|uniref:Ribonucleoside-triphosphate reductase n=1 Tax=Candidatus Nomurabacteria bacterium RIFCSPHIGHO2_02_FULL_41_18 TaxID=1801754 RepID=A0A1F6W670_9BACT|nr:MAG: ribonucleoside-triphosphate reductase [Candidatus Nomurabacteria bacterium RIFCSPHIGHO2_01_FULL_41_71]OGI77175.1 MAG: ribonucleoside-triphosphate reductase [Candidatus Nomurabacteria bacterium RIFCSPHIGHO2_02_FULL_41_18]OGI89154.1 MAG: ribonucleoside-triphosphate reductase [Candidatus Nomurabacteria bacterium RIFCSPLOWO2_01_FULL_41_52b]OGJ00242.1 MAG: ribonucleoside-triphosphate reductase [Candidatus Nomurabacteria bacterium RIFCSPLOWO2_02_FULL_41_9]